ncbi:3'-5' exonuclease, partial [Candidatus Dojkabacteria bacterium]|nr:3'-5' exonuclease [Candidatus Dojkabacteria bacterium]
MDEKKLLYLDTETTDIQAKDIVQLAFITDNPDIWLNLYFNPTQEISYSAMAIHSITPEEVADCPKFNDAVIPDEGKDVRFSGYNLVEYLTFLSKNYIWVAHNADFD